MGKSRVGRLFECIDNFRIGFAVVEHGIDEVAKRFRQASDVASATGFECGLVISVHKFF
jgi:hypothetical protein